MLKFNQLVLGFVLVLALGISSELSAQSQSYSNIFIPEKGFVSIFGEHSFVEGGNGVSPGMISTARVGSKGYVNFIGGSSWTGASDVQFIDGYVRVYHDNAFVFPVGANGKYRPVSISGAALTSVGYFDRNPAKVTKRASANKAPSAPINNQLVIEQVSDSEYWVIEGKKATNLTFSYGKDSKVGELTQRELSNLSIIGWKNGQWKVIPSSFDVNAIDNASHLANPGKDLSNFIKGSITTTEEVIPNDYDYFTLAGINVAALGGETAFSMFPNPRLTRMPLNVEYLLPTTEGGTLRIFSTNGSLLVERTVEGNHGTIVLAEVTNAPGAYTVSLTDSEGNTLSKKLIVVSE